MSTSPTLKAVTTAALWQALTVVAVLYFLVGSYWFQYWYALWLVAFAALLPLTPWAARLLPTYVLGGMLATPTLDFLNNHKPAPVLAPLPASVLYVAILLLPLALSLAAGCLQQIRLSRAMLRPITPSSMSQMP
jgi:hypothetical protein